MICFHKFTCLFQRHIYHTILKLNLGFNQSWLNLAASWCFPVRSLANVANKYQAVRGGLSAPQPRSVKHHHNLRSFRLTLRYFRLRISSLSSFRWTYPTGILAGADAWMSRTKRIIMRVVAVRMFRLCLHRMRLSVENEMGVFLNWCGCCAS